MTPPRQTLPPAYAVFEPVLRALSGPLLQVLGGHLARFEPLAAQLGRRRFDFQGEFEGLEGLTHQGELSHLLPTELVLRSEAPLEFLRRLVEGEALHYRKRFADPGAQPAYRIMLSIGPRSLGHGRLLALAALFFLARVAVARGADLHWCFLPSLDEAPWFEGLSANGVKRMLRAASHREMTAEDVTAAAEAWAARRAGGRAPGPVDWVIGGLGRIPLPSPIGSRPATDSEGNVLSFRLDPPRGGQARTAVAMLRERGHLTATAFLGFPEDAVCVSALRTPFRPLDPGRAKAALPPPGQGPAPIGWAPEGLALGGGGLKLVRMKAGLLHFRIDRSGDPVGLAFVPLLPGVRLASVAQSSFSLSILAYSAEGSKRFVHATFNPDPINDSHVSRSEPIDADHLFRKHGPLAIPCRSGARFGFFSASGMPFSLDRENSNAPLTVAPLYKQPSVLWANGGYHLVGAGPGAPRTLSVHKHTGVGVLTVLAREDLKPGRLFGACYSHPARSMAYSLAPTFWTILSGAAGRATEHPQDAIGLRLGGSERPITVSARDGGMQMRLWSDARRNGDGWIWSLHQAAGSTLVRQKYARLGDDALDVCRVEAGDDGIWVLVANGEGDPEELRWHRGRNAAVRRYPLAPLVAAARVISLEAHFD